MSKLPIRFLLTFAIVAVAVLAASALWRHNFYSPWTRDARVRADVIELAPDVSGPIVEIAVAANQTVRAGDVLLRVDPARYDIALDEARATLAAAQATYAQKQDEARRRAHLDRAVVSVEDRAAIEAAAAGARAAVDAAKAKVAAAELDRQRTELRAPVDGSVTHLNVHLGDYAHAGTPLLAVVDAHSFRIDGYFEESKLQHVVLGAPVRIDLLGGGPTLAGHVDSIDRAIADPEDAGLLSSVNPTFHWVRLAQRIPVRIALDPLPREVTLAAGMTATVYVDASAQPGEAGRQASVAPLPLLDRLQAAIGG